MSVEFFSKKGYDAVSMNEIAAAVGISNAAIYRHFDKLAKEKPESIDSVLIVSDLFQKIHGIILMAQELGFSMKEPGKYVMRSYIGKFFIFFTQFHAST